MDMKKAAGSWKLEAGSWKLEAGSWKLEAGSLIRMNPSQYQSNRFCGI
jgi:hypothetical protein